MKTVCFMNKLKYFEAMTCIGISLFMLNLLETNYENIVITITLFF